MNSRDLIMVMTSLLSMAAGVFLPQVAEPLAAMPRLILIFMLYMSFLAVGMEALVREIRHMTGTLCFLIILRLILLPLLCLAIFRLLMPQFALGAFLLGAAPVGVMAAVFSLMVGANTALILVTNIATSLLLPASLPAVLSATDAGLRLLGLTPLDMPAHLELGHMSLSLCVTILVPFAAAHITRIHLDGLRNLLQRWQFPLITVSIIVSNIAIFSHYGDLLRQSPQLLLKSLAAASLLCLIMTLAAMPLARRMSRQVGMAFLISFGVINNVLVMIVCMEFFTATEAIMSAAYLAPLYVLLFYYRLCSRNGKKA